MSLEAERDFLDATLSLEATLLNIRHLPARQRQPTLANWGGHLVLDKEFLSSQPGWGARALGSVIIYQRSSLRYARSYVEVILKHPPPPTWAPPYRSQVWLA